MYQLWRILELQGRSMKWLARSTRYSAIHVYHIKWGDRQASREFQARCEAVMGIPRSILFAREQENVA